MTIGATERSASESGVVVDKSDWHTNFVKTDVAEKLRRAGETINESKLTKLELVIFLLFFLPSVVIGYFILEGHYRLILFKNLITKIKYLRLKIVNGRLKVVYERDSLELIRASNELLNKVEKFLGRINHGVS